MTFGLFLAQQVTLPRASAYIVAQCLGAIVGAAIARGVQEGGEYRSFASNAVNGVQPGYNIGQALAAEIMGTFVLLYTVLSATDPTRKARDSHVPVGIDSDLPCPSLFTSDVSIRQIIVINWLFVFSQLDQLSHLCRTTRV